MGRGESCSMCKQRCMVKPEEPAMFGTCVLAIVERDWGCFGICSYLHIT